MAHRTCIVEDCDQLMAYTTNGLCRTHYRRFTRHGTFDPLPFGPKPVDPIVRFEKSFTRAGDDECWLWGGTIATNGYGVFHIGKRQLKAHRFSYTTYVGEIGDGLTIDHLCHTRDESCVGPCDHRRCVNPRHLEPVTAIENVRRGRSFSSTNASKTTCVRGHDLTVEANVGEHAQGGRVCLPCQEVRRDERRALYRARRAAGVPYPEAKLVG